MIRRPKSRALNVQRVVRVAFCRVRGLRYGTGATRAALAVKAPAREAVIGAVGVTVRDVGPGHNGPIKARENSNPLSPTTYAPPPRMALQSNMVFLPRLKSSFLAHTVPPQVNTDCQA